VSKIEIQGFRAFGKKPQILDLDTPVAVFWGPNSQGKTSLAEAFEFLLTGKIVRRDLMASTQDEFSDALRNVHISDTCPVYVEAEISVDGSKYAVRRNLVSDYGKKRDCESTLQIDGKTASENELLDLGIVLSQPPLRTPVLSQHTLGYLFSAKPQERAVYFRSLLEVTDLEEFRTAVAALEHNLRPQPDDYLTKLNLSGAIPEVAPFLTPLQTTQIPTIEELRDSFLQSTAAILEAAGVPIPDEDDRLPKVEDILIHRRSKTFPVEQFDKEPLGKWAAPGNPSWQTLQSYIEEGIS
jgi:hypothetical protein